MLPLMLTPRLEGIGRPLKYHSMVGAGLPSNSQVYIKFSSSTISSLLSVGLRVIDGNSAHECDGGDIRNYSSKQPQRKGKNLR